MRWLIVIASVLSAAIACGGSTTGEGGGADGGGAVGGTGNAGAGGAVGGGGTGALGGTGGTGGTGAVYNWELCKGPAECTLFATNCCGGYCVETPLSGWIPVATESLGVVQNQYCSDPVACPDCIEFEHANYLAVCRNDKCTAIDLRKDSISACSADSDCRLRFGTGCCESCAGQSAQLVAVSTKAQLENEVCAGPGACPPCVPPAYPKEAKATCLTGHCQVTWSTSPGP